SSAGVKAPRQHRADSISSQPHHAEHAFCQRAIRYAAFEHKIKMVQPWDTQVFPWVSQCMPLGQIVHTLTLELIRLVVAIGNDDRATIGRLILSRTVACRLSSG